MFREIDINRKPKTPRISIYRPNKVKIANVPEAYNISHEELLGRLNKLSFNIPYEVERDRRLVKNKNINKIKERYLIKLNYAGSSDWYIINEIIEDMDGTRDVKTVKAYSLAYELNDKIIRDYSAVSYNAQQILVDALSGTVWKVGYIYREFLLKYRSFDFTETSVLDMVSQIAKTFGAIPIYDTENRIVNLYDKSEIGENRGFRVSYGKYLKTIKKTSNPDEMVTRLRAYGNDGLSINRVNPTGSDYIESFNYFLYPFKRDENRNVIQQSEYMSDELCHAILDYEALVESKRDIFSNLLSQKEGLLEQLDELETEMFQLETDLAIIEDNLDIAKATEEDTTVLNQQKQNKQNEISTKQDEIDSVQSDIDNIDSQINSLKNELSIENNFSPELIEERNQFIIERTWTDTNYINDVELYADALKKFEELRMPKTTFEISIVNFREILEEQRNWDKLHLGDIITIKYDKFNINIKAAVTEIKYNNGDLSIVITNIEDLNKVDKFIEMLYTSYSTSNAVNFAMTDWENATVEVGIIGEIINNTWDAAKRRIVAGVNESVDISGRGIIIRNPNFPNEMLIAQAGILALSDDGGNTWKTAITPTHIVAERLLGKIIMGENMIIGDPEGTFEIEGNLLTVKDKQEVIRLLLGEYENDKFGLKLFNKTGKDVILDENGILQTWQEGRADNVDEDNGLTLYIYLPDNTISVRKAILRFKLLNFRSYSKGNAAGGGTTKTTSSGGSTTVTSSSGGGQTTSAGGDIVTSTNSGGGATVSSGASYNWTDLLPVAITGTEIDDGEGSHYHIVPGIGNLKNHTHTVYLPNHNHSFSLPSHTHTVSNHTHTVSVPNHTHSLTLPDHTHDVIHGIYTSTKANGIGIIINGVNRTLALGGKFYVDRNDIDITNYMNIGQWNEIKLTSDQLGRIDANVFIQAFMGT